MICAVAIRNRVHYYGAGLGGSTAIDRFVSFACFVGGTWMLVDGQRFFKQLLQDLVQLRGVRLRGSPSRIYAIHVPGVVTFRDADGCLAEESTDATLCYQRLVQLSNLLGNDTEAAPLSIGRLLTREFVDDFERERFPGRGGILRMPSGQRQQIMRASAIGDIHLYDGRSAYGAAVCAYPVPCGRGRVSVVPGDDASECTIVECTVSDSSLHGLLPHKDGGGWSGGIYDTIVASPLLECARGLGAIRVVGDPIYHVYDGYWLEPIVHAAWKRRQDATDPYESAIWRVAIQQMVGKFSERPSRAVYALSAPSHVDGWRLVDWRSNTWAQDDEYFPSLYHPTAGAWVRQIATIPFLGPLVTTPNAVLRVYVDAIALDGVDLPVGDGLGHWREVARGSWWQSLGPGTCEIRDDRLDVVWRCGPPQPRGITMELDNRPPS